jgi:hypothetical protein
MANFRSEEVRRGLVFKFQGQLFKVVDFSTKVTVVGENTKPGAVPTEVKIPIDRLKKPSPEELAAAAT